MSSSENNTNNNDPPRDSENPFISFRRLIDDQITSAIRSLNEQAGIPNQTDRTEQQESSRTPDEGFSSLFNIFGQPPLHGLAMQRPHDMQEQEPRADQTASGQMWGCLMRDATSRGSRDLKFGLCEANSFAWWRHYSGYAPSNLIQDETAPTHMQAFWHRAFLDLMAAQNGERMSARPEPVWSAEALEDAALDVHALEDKRNMVWSDARPQWWPDSRFRPYLFTRSPAPDHIGASDRTEEDMYNSFLAQQDAHRHKRVFDAIAGQEQESASKVVSMIQNASVPSNIHKAQDDQEESQIIAMVTTSHTSRMPDGSSRTIRRFKKTFADGREESSEDVQDNHASMPKSEGKVQDKPEKKKGWFWG